MRAARASGSSGNSAPSSPVAISSVSVSTSTGASRTSNRPGTWRAASGEAGSRSRSLNQRGSGPKAVGGPRAGSAAKGGSSGDSGGSGDVAEGGANRLRSKSIPRPASGRTRERSSSPTLS